MPICTTYLETTRNDIINNDNIHAIYNSRLKVFATGLLLAQIQVTQIEETKFALRIHTNNQVQGICIRYLRKT